MPPKLTSDCNRDAQAGSLERVVRRIGRFTVSGYLLHDWKQLLPLMGRMVVVRCEYLYHMECAEYVAYSELFEEVPDYCEPPRYEIECTRNGDDVSFHARKSA